MKSVAFSEQRPSAPASSIEIRHLRYVAAAAKFGSLRKAALALGVKQSTLSRTITQMETRLGVSLFERTSGGVHLTKPGAGIIRTCHYLVDAVDLLTAAAQVVSRGVTGQLTVGFYTSLSSGNLRASLTDYARKFPQIDFHMVEISPSDLLPDLASGFLDIAIVTGDPSPGEVGARSLWTERIMVALPSSHPLAENKVIHWTDLKDETFLLSDHDPGPELRDVLVSKLVPLGGQPKLVAHNVSQENIKGLVSAGFGVSLVLEASLGSSIPDVAYLEVRDGTGPSRISFSAHWRGDNDNPALANFIALLEERYPVPGGSR
ncbi:LysR family transcriptional regulator [Roseibium aggregatum]|uniref:LysR family transcriptional regulator n=1 Tax=Roseibium aggregatum TaxID=187304 RepID=A0A939EJS6_9HYPH|nr:LysR family transcriptional regulator [Roseibium aggregatum]MBN9673702.1 LysR family transcriptional regulator [Roseibium aggregatum]